MHYLIGTLIAFASLIYWMGQASKGARELSSMASGLKNMPRRRKFQKSASKTALDLIDDPIEAAAIIMIAVARSDGDKRVSFYEADVITHLLETHMELRASRAEDILIQMKAVTSQIVLQDTLLMAMIDVLRGTIDEDDAVGLADMMSEVAKADGPISHDQSELIRSFKERMGIGY